MVVYRTLNVAESVGRRAIDVRYRGLEQLPRDDLKLSVHPDCNVSSGVVYGIEMSEACVSFRAHNSPKERKKEKTLTTPPSLEFSLSIFFTLDSRAIFLLLTSNSSF